MHDIKARCRYTALGKGSLPLVSLDDLRPSDATPAIASSQTDVNAHAASNSGAYSNAEADSEDEPRGTGFIPQLVEEAKGLQKRTRTRRTVVETWKIACSNMTLRPSLRMKTFM